MKMLRPSLLIFLFTEQIYDTKVKFEARKQRTAIHCCVEGVKINDSPNPLN